METKIFPKEIWKILFSNKKYKLLRPHVPENYFLFCLGVDILQLPSKKLPFLIYSDLAVSVLQAKGQGAGWTFWRAVP